jgi:Voltage gated chloride channel
MATLNGNDIPELLRARTLITKILGTICSVASGLPIGPEGPMVHIGAAIASNITFLNWSGIDRFLWPWGRCTRDRDTDLRPHSVEDEAGVDNGASSSSGSSSSTSSGEGVLPKHRTIAAHVCATWEVLNEDAEHREFVSAGASAGLSVRGPRLARPALRVACIMDPGQHDCKAVCKAFRVSSGQHVDCRAAWLCSHC